MSNNAESTVNSIVMRLDGERHCVVLEETDGDFHLSLSVADQGSVDDPECWLATCEALAEASDFDRRVDPDVQIIVRATTVGMVSLDGDGTCSYPLLWAHDGRSQDDARWCRKKFDDTWWMEEAGVVPEAHHLVTKMSWLHRSETEIWDQIRRLCSLEDFVSARLVAGRELLPIMTRPDLVAEFGVWSPATARYSSAILALIDGQRDWSGVLPEVCPPGTRLGLWHNRTICR